MASPDVGSLIRCNSASAGRPRTSGPQMIAPKPSDAQRNHLAFLLKREQVVVILHGPEPGPAVLALQVLGLGEFPGVRRECTEIANLAGRDPIVQRFGADLTL